MYTNQNKYNNNHLLGQTLKLNMSSNNMYTRHATF